MKPVIGITTFLESKEMGKKYQSLNNSYIEAIQLAGGIPILLPIIESDLSDAEEYISICDGILFSGGEDISPLLYNESPSKYLGVVDTRRDFWENELFKAILSSKLPTLGICRGCQVINVFKNGSLYQDIDTQIEYVNGHHPKGILGDEKYHSATLKEGSLLREIFGNDSIEINSFHHQSAKSMGENLVITALSDDEIIEAFENKNMDDHYIMGIQWHPEAMIKRYPEFLEIFKNFVTQCSVKK